MKEHRFVVVFRGPGLAATWPTPIRRPPACRRWIRSPSLEARRRRRWPRSSSRRRRKLLADQPKANGLTLRGFADKPKLPSYRRSLRPASRRDRRLSDVQRPGPTGRHGHRRQSPNACRADRRAQGKLDEVRFLLHPLQIHRQHRRRRQLRRESEADRRTRRRACRASRP